ncbi:Beta-lactamase/transpeptidase-like protein [Naviculisporaceae sp. PSN 640]
MNLDILLQQVSRTISDTFLSRYGNLGLSIGILKDGEQAFLNVGQAKIDGPLSSNETVYLISSMTKPIIALALFILVNDKDNTIDLDTPVSDILGQLKTSKANFLHHANREMKISDLIDLRSEFHKGTNLWESPNRHVPWQTIDPIMALLCNMPRNEGFETEASFVNDRNYVNECFCLLGSIIEKVTHEPWTKFMRERIFEPLGMKNTSVGIDEATKKENPSRFADFHSARLGETLTSLKTFTKTRTPSYSQVEDYVSSDFFVSPRPVRIQSPETSIDTETLGSTPLAAAAGIMSTTADILIFSRKLIDVHNRLNGTVHGSEIERGMASMLDYVQALPQTYTYAAGWNRVLLPWDPRVLDPKPRWPGADGDNCRRLETAMKERCKDWLQSSFDTQQYCQQAWPFFLKATAKEAGHFCPPADLALYHGGNMVGANSFWFFIPSQNIAVVVLCNTRGFFLDAANFSCMVLADALFHQAKSRTTPTPAQMTSHVNAILSKCKVLAQRIAASYLWELVKYEDKLSRDFPTLADNETYAAACVGTYQFCEGIFAVISAGPDETLEFQLYGKGFRYPLRVRQGTSASSAEDVGGRLAMAFAMPMSELTPTGVGGSNRLDVEDFVIVFEGKDEEGRFKRFAWNFARAKSVNGRPPPLFSFERV